LLICLQIFARFLAWLPPAWAERLCRFLGWLVRVVMRRRSQITLNSLSHAFPEQSEAWRRDVFRQSTARLAEMGLFRLAAAYFSPARLVRVLELSPEAERIIQDYEVGGDRHGRPVVIMLPHMTLSEATTLLPGHVPGLKSVHVIFRPLNQPSINRWVTRERERFGAKMISRRAGHNDAMAALRRGEAVAVLFDQDAGSRGAAITFMDRVVSATDLPALMAHRFGADVFLMLPERQGFWRAKLTLTPIPRGDGPVDVTIRAHDALEAYLRRDANTAADWLWLHERWNYAYKPHRRFRLPEKRNQLARANELQGRDALPRKVRFWVRLPDSQSAVVKALPVLRAIRAARPDFECTLIGQGAFEPLVEAEGVADRFLPLPKRGLGSLRAFYAMRLQYPDTFLVLSDRLQADWEAFLTRCPQRFGVERPGKRRRLLTNAFCVSEVPEADRNDEGLVWEMARFYGLRGSV
jgi:lauroyl/myristoyl acyltransferase